MFYNPELSEQQNHGHYPVCLGRKTAIEKYCRRIFGYAFFSCIIMSVFTLFGVNFAVISWIPSLLGQPYEVSHILTQLAILIGMLIISAFGCGQRKFYNVILLVIYLAVTVISLFSEETISRICGFIIGAAGVLTCYKAPFVMLEYNQLMQTEGFPLFNEHLAEQEENRIYKSIHDRECYNDGFDNSMIQPKETKETAFTGRNIYAEMPEMLDLPIPASSNDAEKVFSVGSEKFCKISESAIKTI